MPKDIQYIRSCIPTYQQLQQQENVLYRCMLQDRCVFVETTWIMNPLFVIYIYFYVNFISEKTEKKIKVNFALVYWVSLKHSIIYFKLFSPNTISRAIFYCLRSEHVLLWLVLRLWLAIPMRIKDKNIVTNVFDRSQLTLSDIPQGLLLQKRICTRQQLVIQYFFYNMSNSG